MTDPSEHLNKAFAVLSRGVEYQPVIAMSGHKNTQFLEKFKDSLEVKVLDNTIWTAEVKKLGTQLGMPSLTDESASHAELQLACYYVRNHTLISKEDEFRFEVSGISVVPTEKPKPQIAVSKNWVCACCSGFLAALEKSNLGLKFEISAVGEQRASSVTNLVL